MFDDRWNIQKGRSMLPGYRWDNPLPNWTLSTGGVVIISRRKSEMESAYELLLFPFIASALEDLLLFFGASMYTPHRDSPILHIINGLWILNVNMQSANNDLSHRSYSTKLSMATQSDLRAPVYDDMTIAEGLLNNSKVPHRTGSFTGTHGLSHSTGQFRSSVALTEASAGGISRRAGRTSNTWTSSDGDVLSDHDEVDDRTVFLQEFNRLARKVRLSPCHRDDIANTIIQHGVRPMVQDDDDPTNVS
jgi:hypothetical protein